MADKPNGGNGIKKRHKINVLLVEDCDADAELADRLLKKSLRFECKVRRVKKFSSAVDDVKKNAFDIVFLDLNLLDSTPEETLKRMALIPYRTPTIVLSGSFGEKECEQAMSMGADTCIDKNKMSVLVLCGAIRDAITRRAQKLADMDIPLQLRHLKELIEERES